MFNHEQWRELPHYLPKHKIPEEVTTFIECTTSPLCVACSGGSDSLALLLLTKLFWSERTVVLLHYNHRIRTVSDKEERQMIDLAQKLEVKIEVGHRPIMSETHSSSKTIVAETTPLYSEYSTTPSEPPPPLDEEITTEDFLKTDRSEFLPLEHNAPYLQNLLHLLTQQNSKPFHNMHSEKTGVLGQPSLRGLQEHRFPKKVQSDWNIYSPHLSSCE